MEIARNVHLIPGIIANPYLLIDAQGLTLIDTGMPGNTGKILCYIKELGYVPGAVKQILITHADFDHVGSLAKLKAETEARVFTSAFEAEAIEQGAPSRPLKPRNIFAKWLFDLMQRLFHAAPVQVDERIAEGITLPILSGLQVLETSGHTPGHISLYLPGAGILFCGDSMVSENGSLRGSTGANTWDQAKADESVKRQQALGARIICPGHGAVVKK